MCTLVSSQHVLNLAEGLSFSQQNIFGFLQGLGRQGLRAKNIFKVQINPGWKTRVLLYSFIVNAVSFSKRILGGL